MNRRPWFLPLWVLGCFAFLGFGGGTAVAAQGGWGGQLTEKSAGESCEPFNSSGYKCFEVHGSATFSQSASGPPSVSGSLVEIWKSYRPNINCNSTMKEIFEPDTSQTPNRFVVSLFDSGGRNLYAIKGPHDDADVRIPMQQTSETITDCDGSVINRSGGALTEIAVNSVEGYPLGRSTTHLSGSDSVDEDGITTSWTWDVERGKEVEDPSVRDALCAVTGDEAYPTEGLASAFEHGGAKAQAKALGGVGVALGGVGVYCGITQENSNTFAHAGCIGLGSASTGLGVAGLADFWNPGGWVAFGLSAVTGLASSVACHFDPPDPDFTTIARPSKPRSLLAPALKLKGSNRLLAKPMKQLDRNARAIFGIGEAMNLCIDRAAGAEAVGDAEWAAKQHRCAGDFAAQVARLYAQQKSIRRSMAGALRRAGAGNPKLGRVAPKRLAAFAVGAMNAGGASGAQARLLAGHLDEVFRKLSGRGRPLDLVAGPELLRSLDKSAAAFRGLAAREGAAAESGR